MTTMTTTSAGPTGQGGRARGPRDRGGRDCARTSAPSTPSAGIDLEIRPGEVVAFLGPNGAGKTTTIDMLLGLSDPTAGTVTVFGQSPAQRDRARPGRRRHADGGLLKDITVRETVELTGSLFVHHVRSTRC